jgi:uncharacterized protein
MTENELQNLLKAYHVPRHIMSHMEKVEKVARFIAQKLNSAGGDVDMELLRQAALLHDLVKICDFEELDLTGFDGFTGEDVQFWTALIKACRKDGHITAVCNILTDLNEKKLAQTIRKHRFGCLIDPDPAERPVSIEEKILYYADKRVRHSEITSIKERLEDGRRRYFPDGKIPSGNTRTEKELHKLEAEICGKAGISPEDINESNL